MSQRRQSDRSQRRELGQIRSDMDSCLICCSCWLGPARSSVEADQSSTLLLLSRDVFATANYWTELGRLVAGFEEPYLFHGGIALAPGSGIRKSGPTHGWAGIRPSAGCIRRRAMGGL